MQRYHGGSSVNNTAFGGIQARDISRSESPAVPPNFSLNPSEPLGRNMRYALATVILRVLGSRIVHEDAGHFVSSPTFVPLKIDLESCRETYGATELLCGESLFDFLLLELHVLLICYQPSWLKPESESESESKSSERSKHYAAFDCGVAENLQADLDRMELPNNIRWRIQTAMPILFQSAKCSISCHPSALPPNALACIQSCNPVTIYNPSPHQRNLPVCSSTNLKTRAQVSQHNPETDIIDQWALLEDGTGSGPPLAHSVGVSGGDHSNLKASNWLKGVVRVRTDLTYIGAVDEDS